MTRYDDWVRLKAARLRTMDLSEAQIAAILNISTATVNDAIRWAITNEWLRPQAPYIFEASGLATTTLEEIERIVAEVDLQLKLRSAISSYVKNNGK